ncbi:MAG TPA: XapX domain-containing protein [Pseudoduganella sp.]
MKMYIVSLAAGVLVGLIYGFLNVRSPAPPIIALVGLLGILAGEQLPPLIRQLWQPGQTQTSWLERQVKPHCFGELPHGPDCNKSLNGVAANEQTSKS